jgi:MATE family multidrug resistance protein
MSGLFALLIFNRSNDRRFAVIRNRAFDPSLFRRLMQYGLPNGVQFFIDLFAITAFIFMVGRLGEAALAASNIVFSLNTLAFLPMIGFGMGLSVLVGQFLGGDRPKDAERATASTVRITFGYMSMVALLFVLAPEWLMGLFRSRLDPSEDFRVIVDKGVILLQFVAFYSLFDTLFIVYSSAIKGAGDTRYVMWTLAVLSFGTMVIPVFVGVIVLDAGLYVAWACITFYVCLAGLIFRRRYFKGQWKMMRVIGR